MLSALMQLSLEVELENTIREELSWSLLANLTVDSTKIYQTQTKIFFLYLLGVKCGLRQYGRHKVELELVLVYDLVRGMELIKSLN